MSLVQMDYQTIQIMEVKQTLFRGQDQYCFLYVNNHTPAHDDVLADYTPASYHGASAQAVVWSAPPALDGTGGGFLQADSCIFRPSSGGLTQSVYGYYVQDMLTSDLLFAERFAGGPYTIGGTTDPFTVVPVYRELSIP